MRVAAQLPARDGNSVQEHGPVLSVLWNTNFSPDYGVIGNWAPVHKLLNRIVLPKRGRRAAKHPQNKPEDCDQERISALKLGSVGAPNRSSDRPSGRGGVHADGKVIAEQFRLGRFVPDQQQQIRFSAAHLETETDFLQSHGAGRGPADALFLPAGEKA